MSEKIKLDHVSLLVNDLDQAVTDYTDILRILDPEAAKNIVRYENFGEGEGANNWATFASDQCQIQLFEPIDREGFLGKRLQKYGEGLHHVCFTSSNVEATVKKLIDAGIPLTSKTLDSSPTLPWQKWTFVHFGKAHGILIEIGQRYKTIDGKWVEHRED
jgi:methylmalonyl-CoA/ethylmalonyl-CoA epimerase